MDGKWVFRNGVARRAVCMTSAAVCPTAPLPAMSHDDGEALNSAFQIAYIIFNAASHSADVGLACRRKTE